MFDEVKFQQLIENAVTSALEKRMPLMVQPQQVAPEKKYLYSIKGLAEFMQCSVVTAQKLKNSGRIPYKQVNRKVIFDCEAVIAAISINAKTVRR
jgi:hypothetical protein